MVWSSFRISLGLVLFAMILGDVTPATAMAVKANCEDFLGSPLMTLEREIHGATSRMEIQEAVYNWVEKAREIMVQNGYTVGKVVVDEYEQIGFKVLSAPIGTKAFDHINEAHRLGIDVYLGGSSSKGKFVYSNRLILLSPAHAALGLDIDSITFRHELMHAQLTMDMYKGRSSFMDAEIRDPDGRMDDPQLTQVPGYLGFLNFQELATTKAELEWLNQGVPDLSIFSGETSHEKLRIENLKTIRDIQKEILKVLESKFNPVRFRRDPMDASMIVVDLTYDSTTGQKAVLRIYLPELNGQILDDLNQAKLVDLLSKKMASMRSETGRFITGEPVTEVPNRSQSLGSIKMNPVATEFSRMAVQSEFISQTDQELAKRGLLIEGGGLCVSVSAANILGVFQRFLGDKASFTKQAPVIIQEIVHLNMGQYTDSPKDPRVGAYVAPVVRTLKDLYGALNLNADVVQPSASSLSQVLGRRSLVLAEVSWPANRVAHAIAILKVDKESNMIGFSDPLQPNIIQMQPYTLSESGHMEFLVPQLAGGLKGQLRTTVAISLDKLDSQSVQIRPREGLDPSVNSFLTELSNALKKRTTINLPQSVELRVRGSGQRLTDPKVENGVLYMDVAQGDARLQMGQTARQLGFSIMLMNFSKESPNLPRERRDDVGYLLAEIMVGITDADEPKPWSLKLSSSYEAIMKWMAHRGALGEEIWGVFSELVVALGTTMNMSKAGTTPEQFEQMLTKNLKAPAK